MIGHLEVLQDVVRRLEGGNLDYFLVGSLASMYYGQPRFTNDIDLVVRIRADQLTLFASSFRRKI